MGGSPGQLGQKYSGFSFGPEVWGSINNSLKIWIENRSLHDALESRSRTCLGSVPRVMPVTGGMASVWRQPWMVLKERGVQNSFRSTQLVVHDWSTHDFKRKKIRSTAPHILYSGLNTEFLLFQDGLGVYPIEIKMQQVSPLLSFSTWSCLLFSFQLKTAHKLCSTFQAEAWASRTKYMEQNPQCV